MSTIHDWKQALDKDKFVGSFMLDFSKAFDTVSHSILLRKLNSYGTCEAKGSGVVRQLSSWKEAECLHWFCSLNLVQRGVPQGLVLGPLLFTLDVNDLPLAVRKGKIKQYADDTVLYCGSDCSEDLFIA